MKLLAIIPARGGSKGVPHKNIKPLAGKPLIQYTIESALNSTLISKILVSSDSDEIINFSRKFPVDIPFKRPAHLAGDTTPSIDVILHAIDYYRDKGEYYEAMILLQPTYPFRTGQFIDEAVKKFIESKADSLISVLEVPHQFNPHWAFEEDVNGFLKISTGEKSIIPRRQELPSAYFRDGGIYITKVETLRERKSILGERNAYIISNKKSYVNIDTLEDWDEAEKKAKLI